MKKLFLVVTAIIFFCSSILAQNYKAAEKAFNIYNLDPTQKTKLIEAEKQIQGTPNSNDIDNPAFYLLKGSIYNEIATQIVTIKQVGIGSINDLPKVKDPAIIAYNTFAKALEIAGKSTSKYELNSALKGLQATQSNLQNLGIITFENKNYNSAYENFNSVLKAHALLKKNNSSSSLDDIKAFHDHQYYTGLAALNAEKTSQALTIFEQLYKSNYDNAAIYEAMYTTMLKLNGDEKLDAAYKYIAEGRKKYPEDSPLLFAQINHFLKQGRLDELISTLKLAIAKEPENIGLYATLGNVYDNLYQKEYQAGNKQKAVEYFNNALNYYNQALNKDSKYIDAIYSIGALYYNKAAGLSKELNSLDGDFSKDGIKKYETKKAEIFLEFDKALPYFKKAENLNPNDLNTLIALKEIYARKDDIKTSDEFKKRLENVKGGGKNEISYFK